MVARRCRSGGLAVGGATSLGPAPAPITVSPAQQAVLAALLGRASYPQALALRTRIVLGAADGQRNEPLARQVGCTPNTVRKWWCRWAAAAPHLATADDTHVARGLGGQANRALLG